MGEVLPTSAREKLVALLQKCRQDKNPPLARRLYAYLCEHQLESHRVLGNHLVPMLVDCGCLLDAQHAFDRLAHRNEYSWASLILGYSDSDSPQHALLLYQKMQDDHAPPNIFIYLALLKACVSLHDAENGRSIHAETIKLGVDTQPFMGNVLVDMYGRFGSSSEARVVFDKLTTHDRVLWASLIAAYAQNRLAIEAVCCFEQMQQDGLSPKEDSLVCILKICCDIGASHCIHAEIVKKGSEPDLYVSSTVVDIYAKRGLLLEARRVFDRMPVRNVVLWTAMIAGYAEHGFGEVALTVFGEMLQEGVAPDAVTFPCTLKACGILPAVERGRILHGEIAKLGFENETVVGNAIMDMYAKCNSLMDAHHTFDTVPVRSTVSWNTIVTGYTENEFGEEALNLSAQMHLEGIPPDANTFISNLNACVSVGALGTALSIHAEITKRGLERDLFVGNALVDMLHKFGLLAEARQASCNLLARDTVSWNALISGYAELGFGEDALDCFKLMEQENICPNAVTFVCSLKACSMLQILEPGLQIYHEITKRGIEKELYVATMLIDMYASWGLLSEVHDILSRIPVCDAAICNSMIARYTEQDFGKEALDCFNRMQLEGICPVPATFISVLKACGIMESLDIGRKLHTEIVKIGMEKEQDVGNTVLDMYVKCNSLPEARQVFDQLPHRDIVSWTVLTTGYADKGLGREALNCYEEMQLLGGFLDISMLICSLKVCASNKALEKGQKLHATLTERGLERKLYVGDMLMDMYVKFGSLPEARSVFDRLSVQDVTSWNTLIAGYTEHGFTVDALKFYEEMEVGGVSPLAGTYSCTLKACGIAGGLGIGQHIHAEITKRGLESELLVGSTMVDMYASLNFLAEAQATFDNLPKPDVVSWNAMIKGYGENEQSKMAIRCFEKMENQGIRPDPTTFVCLLIACSHACLVHEGRQYFRLMKEKHQIEPTTDHFTCMVDLFARAGLVHEAVRFIESTHCLLSKEVFRSLLTGCKSHGEVELGFLCFQWLAQVSQEDAYPYLTMADIFANAGRWSDAISVEWVRVNAVATKMPGITTIEVNKQLYAFVVGDSAEKIISVKVETLNFHMKDVGYVPSVDSLLKNRGAT